VHTENSVTNRISSRLVSRWNTECKEEKSAVKDVSLAKRNSGHLIIIITPAKTMQGRGVGSSEWFNDIQRNV
jgi:hypothetical protein